MPDAFLHNRHCNDDMESSICNFNSRLHSYLAQTYLHFQYLPIWDFPAFSDKYFLNKNFIYFYIFHKNFYIKYVIVMLNCYWHNILNGELT